MEICAGSLWFQGTVSLCIEQSLHSFNRQLLIEYLEYLLCASTVLNKP